MHEEDTAPPRNELPKPADETNNVDPSIDLISSTADSVWAYESVLAVHLLAHLTRLAGAASALGTVQAC